MKKQKGFSLIELLIVVAIILIIAAIAIPNLLRSKMAAQEASAVGSLRTINTAQVTYSSTYGTGFTDLATLASSGLIDSVLGGGKKSGYSFTSTASGGSGTAAAPYTTYFSDGAPQNTSSGTRDFCSDQSGVIRFIVATTGCAATSSPLQ